MNPVKSCVNYNILRPGQQRFLPKMFPYRFLVIGKDFLGGHSIEKKRVRQTFRIVF